MKKRYEDVSEQIKLGNPFCLLFEIMVKEPINRLKRKPLNSKKKKSFGFKKEEKNEQDKKM